MKKFIQGGVINLVLAGIIIVNIVPFLYMFLMSFKSTMNVHDISISLDELTLMQYEKIFALSDFRRYIFNSFLIAIVAVILTLALCSLAGYAFAKLKFKGSEKIFLLVIMTMIVPLEMILVPMFLISKNLGWLNTYWGLILPLPAIYGALGVFIMRQAMLDIPADLIDAAKIDGCGNFKIFLRVVLPLVRSSLLALSIFTFVGSWNNFVWPLVVSTRPEMKTLPVALSTMQTQYNSDVGLTMACAVINFLPPFVFYIFMQGKFKEGMALSGMKG